MANWIDCKEKLPKDNEWVLIYTPIECYGHHILIGGYYSPFSDWHILHAGHLHSVTHWQPLPALPEIGDETDEKVTGDF